MLYLSGVEFYSESRHAKNKANISNTVVNHGLKGCCICVCPTVSSANEEERHNPNPLSTNKELKYIVSRDQDDHRY